MSTLHALATLFLCLIIVLCGGTILWYLGMFSSHASHVEEIRHLRQEGLAIHQEGEQ